MPDPACDYIEGAAWWTAHSDTSVRALQRAFEDQEVAGRLYETIGAMFEAGRHRKKYLIAIQVMHAGEWDVDISLSDAGVYLEEPITEGQLCDILEKYPNDFGKK